MPFKTLENAFFKKMQKKGAKSEIFVLYFWAVKFGFFGETLKKFSKRHKKTPLNANTPYSEIIR